MQVVALLVIGAGPYGVAVASQAMERGVDTIVVGHPMGFWTDHMPEGMFLRSGTDWHIDGSGIETFEAFIEDRGLSSADMDPVPIAVFLEYAAWFQARKHVSVRDLLVMGLERDDDSAFVASLNDGSQVSAEVVVAAPGIAYFRQFPEWATRLPEGVSAHTCDLVHFKELAGRGSWSSEAGKAPTNGPHCWANTMSSGWTSFTGTTCPVSSELAGSSSTRTWPRRSVAADGGVHCRPSSKGRSSRGFGKSAVLASSGGSRRASPTRESVAGRAGTLCRPQRETMGRSRWRCQVESV